MTFFFRDGAVGRADALGTEGAGPNWMRRTAGGCTALPVFATAVVAGETPASIAKREGCS